MQRVLSGIRPTGQLHIGNYLGSMHQWIELANDPNYTCFFMVADYHALAPEKGGDLRTASLDLLAWELAAGLSVDRSTVFLQSAIPAHNDLTRILSTFVTVAELGRMTQYKDLVNQGSEVPSAALLMYPVLMAADILLYKADLVPVGDDQEQHIEITRALAKRLNDFAGNDVFVLPKARLTAHSRIMSLHDPTKKMSKSLPQGAILMTDEPDVIRQKIMRAVTDSTITGRFAESKLAETGLNDAERALLHQTMTPGLRNLFLLLEATSNVEKVDELLGQYAHKTLLYKDLKEVVANSVVEFLKPMQVKYQEIRADEAKLKQLLADGTARAQIVADSTLKEVKSHLNILEL